MFWWSDLFHHWSIFRHLNNFFVILCNILAVRRGLRWLDDFVGRLYISHDNTCVYICEWSVLFGRVHVMAKLGVVLINARYDRANQFVVYTPGTTLYSEPPGSVSLGTSTTPKLVLSTQRIWWSNWITSKSLSRNDYKNLKIFLCQFSWHPVMYRYISILFYACMYLYCYPRLFTSMLK
jgi:hypothetical protein